MVEEKGLDGHVTFTGYVPYAEVIEHLRSTEIGIVPDPSNPLNDVSTVIKAIEYMAAGRPVVGFDLKETRVSVGEAGILVSANDDRAFAEAIRDLMDDPARRETLGRAGRRRVETELSWERVNVNLLRMYASLGYGRDAAEAWSGMPAGETAA